MRVFTMNERALSLPIFYGDLTIEDADGTLTSCYYRGQSLEQDGERCGFVWKIYSYDTDVELRDTPKINKIKKSLTEKWKDTEAPLYGDWSSPTDLKLVYHRDYKTA